MKSEAKYRRINKLNAAAPHEGLGDRFAAALRAEEEVDLGAAVESEGIETDKARPKGWKHHGGIRGAKRPGGRHIRAGEAVEKFVAAEHSSLSHFIERYDGKQYAEKRIYGKADDPNCGSLKILDLFTRGKASELSAVLGSHAGFQHCKWLLSERDRANKEWEASKVTGARKREQFQRGGASSSGGSHDRAWPSTGWNSSSSSSKQNWNSSSGGSHDRAWQSTDWNSPPKQTSSWNSPPKSSWWHK